jgi:hypothetical protein
MASLATDRLAAGDGPEQLNGTRTELGKWRNDSIEWTNEWQNDTETMGS